MMSRFKKFLMAVFLLPLCFTTGFTFKPAEDSQKTVWPLPPDPPKIVYVMSFTERKDMGVKKGFFQKLKEIIVGKAEEPRILRPTGVFSDGKGTVYVTDTGLQVVHVFDFANKKYRQVFKLQGDPGNDPALSGQPATVRLLSPIGVAADAAGNLYVSDSILKRVFIFNPKGRWIRTLGNEGEFQRPTGLALNRGTGLLYVVDTLGNRVVAFKIELQDADKKGKKNQGQGTVAVTQSFAFGNRGGGEGEFNFPTHVAVDRQGDIYVTDSLNFRVQRFDPDGHYLGQFGKAGDLIGSFSKPKGIAVDGENHVYVVDNLYDTIQIFDSQGNLLLHFGGHGGGPGNFWLPIGIGIDEDRYIFISDTYNQRVQVFRYLGE